MHAFRVLVVFSTHVRDCFIYCASGLISQMSFSSRWLPQNMDVTLLLCTPRHSALKGVSLGWNFPWFTLSTCSTWRIKYYVHNYVVWYVAGRMRENKRSKPIDTDVVIYLYYNFSMTTVTMILKRLKNIKLTTDISSR